MLARLARSLRNRKQQTNQAATATRAAGPKLEKLEDRRMLAVSPAAQGRGVGSALLGHLVDQTAQRGRAGIVCSSQPSMRARPSSESAVSVRSGYV